MINRRIDELIIQPDPSIWVPLVEDLDKEVLDPA